MNTFDPWQDIIPISIGYRTRNPHPMSERFEHLEIEARVRVKKRGFSKVPVLFTLITVLGTFLLWFVG